MVVALLLAMGAFAAPTGDGMFAVFTVTRAGAPLGEFSCRLEFEKVPRTVANFVGLAEGTAVFVDFLNGNAVRRPFYDGLTFHRVVNTVDFSIIQAGSPKGDGTDGPGYTFPDEFDATLSHDRAGILSMANSGLNSNGSQFFVTRGATPWLDGVHSVFGEVVEGAAVTDLIQQGDVIESVAIIRNGAAAVAFDAAAHGVPLVMDAKPSLTMSPTDRTLTYAQPANSEVFIFHGPDLAGWSLLPGQEVHGPVPVPSPRDVSAVTIGQARHFFTTARVDYPDPVLTPSTVTGRQLVLTEDQGAVVFRLNLTTATSGTYTYEPSGSVYGPYPISAYQWRQEAYRGRLTGSISGLSDGLGVPITQANISFSFTTASAGQYRGNLYNLIGQPLPVAGNFVVSDL